MDGWVGGWIDGWMNGWMDERMEGCREGWREGNTDIYELTHRQTAKRSKRLIDIRQDERRDNYFQTRFSNVAYMWERVNFSPSSQFIPSRVSNY